MGRIAFKLREIVLSSKHVTCCPSSYQNQSSKSLVSRKSTQADKMNLTDQQISSDSQLEPRQCRICLSDSVATPRKKKQVVERKGEEGGVRMEEGGGKEEEGGRRKEEGESRKEGSCGEKREEGGGREEEEGNKEEGGRKEEDGGVKEEEGRSKEEGEKETPDEDNPFINPCLCSGTMKYIHVKCLQFWLASKITTKKASEVCKTLTWNNLECELCKFEFPSKFPLSPLNFN